MAGLALIIVSANTFAVLQAIDGIALKRQCILIHAASAAREEKAVAFRVAEGIRWTD
jgi:putative N-acetylmannosamine-6-phosphate epimerase